MFPEFLHEIRGSLTRGRDLGYIPLANEEIATKHGEVLGQSAFAVLPPEHHRNNQGRVQSTNNSSFAQEKRRHVPAERAQKITKGVRSR
jgi:hypothetical protein